MSAFRPRFVAALALTLAACEPPPSPPAPPPPPRPLPLPAAPASAVPPEPAPTGRLPTDVRPVAYRLELRLAPDRSDFSGTAEITADLDRARSVVWIHAQGIRARAARFEPAGAPPVPAAWDPADPSGVVALRPAWAVGPGRVRIHIDYEGPFDERLEGLYRVALGGHSYAFTQFEPVWARRAFPCFDEPVFKTPFDVTLTVPHGQAAIANAPEVERATAGDGFDRVRFAPTPPMPTYLVAFAVGPLDVVAGPDAPPNGVRTRPLPIRGVTAKGRGREIEYALANTGPILGALESYTGIPYPYDKLDILAVPDKAGAMENPGAVTFREWLLLVDPRTAPVQQKRAYAGVMAHELAHMWFGDLVTMPWWDDIWLNEAFATWMTPIAVGSWKPDYHADVALLDRVHDAMGVDGLVSARQIRQPVQTVHDIHNSFDPITYQKGGGVLAMFEQWIGRDTFRAGIRAYLGARPFGTATADDLLAALSRAAGRDVGTPFRTFLDQPGVPVVDVALRCDGAPRLDVRQARYLPLGSAGDADRTWQIPLCVRYPAPPRARAAGPAPAKRTATPGANPTTSASASATTSTSPTSAATPTPTSTPTASTTPTPTATSTPTATTAIGREGDRAAVCASGSPGCSGSVAVASGPGSSVARAGDQRERRAEAPAAGLAAPPGRPGTAVACDLVTGREHAVPLQGANCPAWILPNADAAGYYRWTLSPDDLARLLDAGWPSLSPRERMSVATSLRTSFARGTTPGDAVFRSLRPIAADAHPSVASTAMDFARTAREWVWSDPAARAAVEAYGRKLFAKPYADLGWAPRAGVKAEDGERAILRQAVVSFLATAAMDPAVRSEAAKRGRAYVGWGKDGAIHADAVDPELAGVALAVAVQEGDAAFFDALVAKIATTEDELVRARILGALGSATRPELAARARDLVLDPRLKITEMTAPLDAQMGLLEMRDEAWAWLKARIDAVLARMPPSRAGWMPWIATRFCDRAHVDEARALFGPRVDRMDGGPRNLAEAIEALTLCVARREAQEASVRAFFAATPKPAAKAR